MTGMNEISCDPVVGDITALVRLYRQRGWGVCRLRPGEKRPTYQGWSMCSLEEADFQVGDGVGLLTGWISSDLVCIDLDSEAALQQADLYLPPTGLIGERPGKLRSHRYFQVANVPAELTSTATQAAAAALRRQRHPGLRTKRYAAPDGTPLVDRLATGAQAAAPPTRHPSGEVRRWASLGEPARVEACELVAAVVTLARACGHRPQAGLSRASRVLGNWQRQWGEDAEQARRDSPDRADRMERCLAFVRRAKPAVRGRGGDMQTFAVACSVRRGFDLAMEDALEVMRWYSEHSCKLQNGSPDPWTDQALRHKLERADSDGSEERGRRYYEELGMMILDELPADEPDYAWFEEVTVAGLAAAAEIAADPEAVSSGEVCPGTAPAGLDADDVAGIDDLISAGAELEWLWDNWIQLKVVNVIASEPGVGKTRLVADLIRRIRHGLPWPDGAPMNAPADAKVLYVPADLNHDELVTLAKAFDIADAIKFNAPKSDPYAGTLLETAEDFARLEAHVKAVRPLLLVIDTTGNATDKNVCRAEEAKALFQPLQVLAQKHKLAVICLTHTNKEGGVYGRRAREKARVVIHLQRPDDDGQDRRRIEVVKSNSKYPKALGVTMGDNGNDYDAHPPDGPGPAQERQRSPRKSPTKVKQAMTWLPEFLADGPRLLAEIRAAAEEQGFKAETLYTAKERLGLQESTPSSGRGITWYLAAGAELIDEEELDVGDPLSEGADVTSNDPDCLKS
jgi:hypothetical protein